MSETKPSETRPKKMIRRSVAIALGLICIVLIAGLGEALAFYTLVVSDRDKTIASKDSQIASLKTQISDQNSTISSFNTQISQLNSNITKLQQQVDNLTKLQQQVNVTNWPTQQLEPPFVFTPVVIQVKLDWSPIGQGVPGAYVYCGGYSKMFIYVYIVDICHNSAQNMSEFSLGSVDWVGQNPPANATGTTSYNFAPYTSQFAPSPLNFSVTGRTNIPGPAQWNFVTDEPAEVDVRGPYALLNIVCTNSTCPSGWIVFNIYCYLRNG